MKEARVIKCAQLRIEVCYERAHIQCERAQYQRGSAIRANPMNSIWPVYIKHVKGFISHFVHQDFQFKQLRMTETCKHNSGTFPPLKIQSKTTTKKNPTLSHTCFLSFSIYYIRYLGL